jgi:predicted RNase H-like HicB family nuclease
MKFITTLQQDEDGIWIAECPAIPGCVSQGKTQQEATANLREAMQTCLAVRSAQGMPLVVETREIELQTA